jgi:hypothetical protein
VVLFQCTADSIKVEPCSGDETHSMLSFGEDDEEDHPMPVFIPVMKCEVKVSCVLNTLPFCKNLILGSYTKIYQHIPILVKIRLQ